MNMTYDPKVDALYIKLTAKTVVRSQRVPPKSHSILMQMMR